jgi:hypothetical protein
VFMLYRLWAFYFKEKNIIKIKRCTSEFSPASSYADARCTKKCIQIFAHNTSYCRFIFVINK